MINNHNNSLGIYIDRLGMLRCRKTSMTDKPFKASGIIHNQCLVHITGPLTPSIETYYINGRFEFRKPTR